MSYAEDFSARRDHTQAMTFLVSRRFLQHAEIDPLSITFPFPHRFEEDETGERLNRAEEIHRSKAIWRGFTGSDLVFIQYGAMLPSTWKGLSPEQREKWANLEYDLLGSYVVMSLAEALTGNGNYSPDEITPVARMLNNRLVNDRIDDLTTIMGFLEMAKEEHEEPSPRRITLERLPTNLNSLYDLLDDSLDPNKKPALVGQIDDYMISRMLE